MYFNAYYLYYRDCYNKLNSHINDISYVFRRVAGYAGTMVTFHLYMFTLYTWLWYIVYMSSTSSSSLEHGHFILITLIFPIQCRRTQWLSVYVLKVYLYMYLLLRIIIN